VRFFFNDLSLAGQFPDAASFCEELRRLLNDRQNSDLVRKNLLCSKALSERPATPTHSFRGAVQAAADRDTVRRVLTWIAQTGPFWEDVRAEVEEDLFHFEDQDVTYQGLGEAARNRLLGASGATYSMRGSRHGCDGDPLDVIQGLLESPITNVAVPNLHSVASMEEAARASLPFPKSWTELLDQVAMKFSSLLLSNDIAAVLRPHPFNSNAAERVLELLGILDALVKSRDDHGVLTDASKQLISNFFSGDRARFTDESPGNKSKFEEQMTFRDPENADKWLFCPFHGKINNPAYRIHIRWPMEATHKKIVVAYIGPKITR